MKSSYAKDDQVLLLQNSRANAAHYVFDYSEANNDNIYVTRELDWMLPAIQATLDIKAEMYYAMVNSRQPFQISMLKPNLYVLLIDCRAVFYLITICIRLQSLGPLSGFLGIQTLHHSYTYKSKFLLDIVKNMIFKDVEVGVLIKDTREINVFRSALLYVVGHELAHVAHGHLNFKTSPEFSDFAKNDEDRNLTIRTLEMDADSSATTTVFNISERLIVDRCEKGQAMIGKSIEETQDLLRKQYVVGVFIAHIFQDALTSNFFPKDHPIGYARFLTANNILMQIFAKEFPRDIRLPEDCRKALVAVLFG